MHVIKQYFNDHLCLLVALSEYGFIGDFNMPFEPSDSHELLCLNAVSTLLILLS